MQQDQVKIDKNKELKEEYVKYLIEVPSHKFASKAIGKDADTTRAWRKEDTEFSARCEAALAEFVRKTLKRTKPEFALERLLKEDFSERSEIAGVEGKPLLLPIPILENLRMEEQNSNEKNQTTSN